MNDLLLSLAATLLVVQAAKVAIRLWKRQRVTWENYVTTGGMPSSHAAVVTSLVTGVYLMEGLESVAFGISIVVACIVMRDAIGVRRTVGEQTSLLRRLLGKEKSKELHDAPGHTPIEVAIGIAIGLALTLAIFLS